MTILKYTDNLINEVETINEEGLKQLINSLTIGVGNISSSLSDAAISDPYGSQLELLFKTLSPVAKASFYKICSTKKFRDHSICKKFLRRRTL